MSTAADKERYWLRSVILPKILANGTLVDNYVPEQSNTFKVGHIDINFIGAEEAFMLTTCYRATIAFDYNGATHTRKLVVKKSPEVPQAVYDVIKFDALFNNEVDFYTRILPELQKYAEGTFQTPKYYYSHIERASANIILGDFAEAGWRVSTQKVNLSLEHLLLAATYIGNFHALGFALKHTKRALFDDLAASLKEPRYGDVKHKQWELTQQTTADRMVTATKQHEPTVDDEFLTKLRSLLNDSVVYGRQIVAPKEPLATLCHGDYLRNNVAYRYDADGLPLAVMMFDYQTMRLSSPMLDLTTFLALSSFAAVRQPHFEKIFTAYTEALTKTYVRLANAPLPEFLSRESLLREYVRVQPLSVGVTSYFLMTLVDPPELSPAEKLSLDRSDEETIEEAWTRGGEVTDRELAAQVRELYELSRKLGVDIMQDIVL